MEAHRQPPALCIFDLDGTLVDSLRDIAEAFNECLATLGLPGRPVDAYRYMIGEGVPMLCERAIGTTHPRLVEPLAELARQRYRERPLRHTRPYAGIDAMLRGLRAAGLRLAVLSNKPHVTTQTVVAHFWPDGVFEHVQGCVDERLRKPHPHYIEQIRRRLDVATEACWMIGDTPTDVAAARNAGVCSVSVTWGFRTRRELEETRPDLIVDSPAELLRLARAG